MSNSIFGDNANTNETSSPQIFGDYAIDLNLICVRNAVITIENNRFYGDCGDDAAVKITQRGGYDVTDDTRTDFTNVTDNANIQSLTISGNDFSNITHVAVDSNSPGTKADIQIGSGLGTDGAPRTYTYGYDFSITSKGNTIVSICDTSNGFLGLQLSNNAKLTGNGEHVAPTGGITKTTGKLDLALEGSAQIMGKVDGGVTITGQVGSSMTIPAGKTLAGKVSFSDGVSISSVDFGTTGVTAGTGGVTLRQGSVIISGATTGAVTISTTGEVLLDDLRPAEGSGLTVSGTADGKVIIKNLTLSGASTLSISAGAYVEVPENGKLVNNSTVTNAISNAGTLVLNTQITTTTSNVNASKSVTPVPSLSIPDTIPLALQVEEPSPPPHPRETTSD